MTQVVANPTRVTLSALDEAGRSALFTDARTANTFAPQPVPDSQLSEIWDLAKWAPTAANFQPLRVLYVRGEARHRLAGHMSDGNKAKTATAPAVAVLALDTRFHEHIPTVMPPLSQMVDVFEADDSARNGTAEFNSALQAGYFLLAVRALGLAAGPMKGFDAAGIDAEFFPDGRWRSILVVNIGQPGVEAFRDRMPRLDESDVIAWAE